MIIDFGRHRGKTVETLVLKDADYVLWVLGQERTGQRLIALRDEVERLIERFDARAFEVKCGNPECECAATRATVYRGGLQLRWWCDVCNPRKECPRPDKLQILSSYRDALWYAAQWCNGRKAQIRALVKMLARAKGASERVGRQETVTFFG